MAAYRAAAAGDGGTAFPGGSASSASSAALGGVVGMGTPAAAEPAAPAGGRLAALAGFECGGGNGLEPLVLAGRMGLPVLDGDLMGRAFPELQASGAAS